MHSTPRAVQTVLSARIFMAVIFTAIGPKQTLCMAVKKQWLTVKWYSDRCTADKYIVASPALLDMAIAAGYKIGYKTFDLVAHYGHLDTLKHMLLKHTENEFWSVDMASKAARGGHLHILEFLVEKHYDFSEWSDPLCSAAANGHLNCVEYLMVNGLGSNQHACDAAAGGGHLNCLMYLHKQGCRVALGTMREALVYGHLDCVQYVFQQHSEGMLQLQDLLNCNAMTSTAAGGDHLECLRFLHQKGFQMTPAVLHVAAKKGHLPCFQYAHENGCGNEMTLLQKQKLREAAAAGNHQHVLEYIDLHEIV